MNNIDNLNIYHKHLSDIATYIDENIALIDEFNSLHDFKVKLDNTIAIGFCTKGKAMIRMNNVDYNLQPNDMIICPPDVILDSTLVSVNFEGRLFVISANMLDMINALSTVDKWNLYQLTNTNPVFNLSPEEMEIFHLYYQLINAHLKTPNSYRYKKERLFSIFQAFAYDIHHSLNELLITQQDTCNEKQGNYIFNGFLKILVETYPRSRKVSYYSDRLHTSPKYLSHICKTQCGETASELIHKHVVKDIQRLFRDPDRTIKEIANELDFPNISFFGSYVRKHLGVSPKEYRKQNT